MDDTYREDPRRLFIDRLVEETRTAIISGIRSVLEEGPAGRSPRQDLVELHEWFRSLEESDKAKVLKIVREAIDGAVFSVLGLLDQEDPYGEDQLYDFALYLQVYDDLESHEANQPSQRSEKLNDVRKPLPLRSEYIGIVEELNEESDDPQNREGR